MKFKNVKSSESYNKIASNAKICLDADQRRPIGGWQKRVLVLDKTTLYSYRKKDENGSLKEWEIGGSEVRAKSPVGRDGRYLVAIARQPVFSVLFAVNTWHEQASFVEALSTSGATVIGIQAILLLNEFKGIQEAIKKSLEEDDNFRRYGSSKTIKPSLEMPQLSSRMVNVAWTFNEPGVRSNFTSDSNDTNDQDSISSKTTSSSSDSEININHSPVLDRIPSVEYRFRNRSLSNSIFYYEIISDGKESAESEGDSEKIFTNARQELPSSCKHKTDNPYVSETISLNQTKFVCNAEPKNNSDRGESKLQDYFERKSEINIGAINKLKETYEKTPLNANSTTISVCPELCHIENNKCTEYINLATEFTSNIPENRKEKINLNFQNTKDEKADDLWQQFNRLRLVSSPILSGMISVAEKGNREFKRKRVQLQEDSLVIYPDVSEFKRESSFLHRRVNQTKALVSFKFDDSTLVDASNSEGNSFVLKSGDQIICNFKFDTPCEYERWKEAIRLVILNMKEQNSEIKNEKIRISFLQGYSELVSSTLPESIVTKESHGSPLSIESAPINSMSPNYVPESNNMDQAVDLDLKSFKRKLVIKRRSKDVQSLMPSILRTDEIDVPKSIDSNIDVNKQNSMHEITNETLFHKVQFKNGIEKQRNSGLAKSIDDSTWNLDSYCNKKNICEVSTRNQESYFHSKYNNEGDNVPRKYLSISDISNKISAEICISNNLKTKHCHYDSFNYSATYPGSSKVKSMAKCYDKMVEVSENKPKTKMLTKMNSEPLEKKTYSMEFPSNDTGSEYNPVKNADGYSFKNRRFSSTWPPNYQDFKCEKIECENKSHSDNGNQVNAKPNFQLRKSLLWSIDKKSQKDYRNKIDSNESDERITWSVSAVRGKFEILNAINGSNCERKPTSRSSSFNKRKQIRKTMRMKKSIETETRKKSFRRNKKFHACVTSETYSNKIKLHRAMPLDICNDSLKATVDNLKYLNKSMNRRESTRTHLNNTFLTKRLLLDKEIEHAKNQDSVMRQEIIISSIQSRINELMAVVNSLSSDTIDGRKDHPEINEFEQLNSLKYELQTAQIEYKILESRVTKSTEEVQEAKMKMELAIKRSLEYGCCA